MFLDSNSDRLQSGQVSYEWRFGINNFFGYEDRVLDWARVGKLTGENFAPLLVDSVLLKSPVQPKVTNLDNSAITALTWNLAQSFGFEPDMIKACSKTSYGDNLVEQKRLQYSGRVPPDQSQDREFRAQFMDKALACGFTLGAAWTKFVPVQDHWLYVEQASFPIRSPSNYQFSVRGNGYPLP